MTNPKIWCKVEVPWVSSWTRVPIDTVTYTADLQDAIKLKFSPKLDAYSSTDLIVQAESRDKPHLNRVNLQDTDTIVEMLQRFGNDDLLEMVSPDGNVTKECCKYFADKILLFVKALNNGK